MIACVGPIAVLSWTIANYNPATCEEALPCSFRKLFNVHKLVQEKVMPKPFSSNYHKTVCNQQTLII